LYPLASNDAGADDIAAFLHEGVERSERVVVVLERDLAGDVRDRLSRVTPWPIDGLRWFDPHDVYGRDPRIDERRQLGTFQAMLGEALVDGFRGLRVIGDVTPVALRDPEGLARWERAADAFEARSPVTGMCVIDRRRVTDDLVESLDVLHPPSGSSTAAFHLHAGERAALALSGEIDAFDAERLARTLETLGGAAFGPTRLIDVSAVTFMSHQALRTLERAAADLDTAIELRRARTGVTRIARELRLERVEVLA